jgi:hypothetical protein
MAVLAALLAPAAWGAAPARAADGDEFAGAWQGELNGQRLVWNIAHPGGKWFINGEYYEGKKAVAAFKGADVKYADGKLTFAQQWIYKPAVGWPDNLATRVEVNGEKLSFSWSQGDVSASGELARKGGTPPGDKPTDKPPDKPADDTPGADFLGKWQRDHDGVQEVITIAKVGDNWSVTGVYTKDGKEIGVFIGQDVKLHDNELSYIFTSERPPPGLMVNDAHVTLKVKGDVITVDWRHGKRKGHHEWERAK